MDERIALNLGILLCERDRRRYRAEAAAHGSSTSPLAELARARYGFALQNIAAMHLVAGEAGVLDFYFHVEATPAQQVHPSAALSAW